MTLPLWFDQAAYIAIGILWLTVAAWVIGLAVSAKRLEATRPIRATADPDVPPGPPSGAKGSAGAEEWMHEWDLEAELAALTWGRPS